MKLILSNYYEKTAKKFFRKHPNLKEKYKEILRLLLKDYKNPNLKFHKLKGKFKKYSAISLSYEYRIILILKMEKEEIHLIDIGSHNEVY